MIDKLSVTKNSFRGNDNQGDSAELHGSLRLRSSSAKYKKWSPDISTEERFRKKKLKEDQYIQNLLQEEQPKSQSRGRKVNSDLNDIETNYSSNSQSANKDPFSLSFIYKIPGIEFLQENFLELEPLLYKDEYAFESNIHENLFEDEQRRIKSLRRQQYSQKDNKDIKEISIYSVDKYKDRMTDYLEEWYSKNNRRMTIEEIEYVAKILVTDADIMLKLQELYLKKKKIVNAQRLRDHLSGAEGKLKEDRINKLPRQIRKYFLLSKSKPKSKSPLPAKSSGIKKNPSGQNDLPIIAKTSQGQKLSVSGIQSIHNSNRYEQGQNSEINEDDQEIRLHYDTEINSLLDRIRSDSQSEVHKTRGLQSTQAESVFEKNDGRQKSINKKTASVSRSPSTGIRKSSATKPSKLTRTSEVSGRNQKFSQPNDQIRGPKTSQMVEELAKEVLSRHSVSKTGPLGRMSDVSIRNHAVTDQIRMSSQLNKYNADPEGYKDRAPAELTENRATRMTSQLGHYEENPFDYKGHGLAKLGEKRITLVSRTDKGDSIVSQKLRPTLIGNNFYHQIIDDVIDANGKRSTFVTVKDEHGSIVAQHPVSLSKLGSFHHAAVVIDNSLNQKRPTLASLLVRNEKGDTIAATEVPITERRKSKGTIVQQISPFVVGSEFYRQTASLTVSAHGPRLTITTFNENGEQISISNVDPKLAADRYVSILVDEQIDEDNGTREFKVDTVNERGEIVTQQSFITRVDSLLKDYNAVSVVEEIEDNDGKRTLTLVVNKDNKGGLSLSRQYRPSVLGEKYYFEVVNDIVNGKGQRVTTISAKGNNGNVLVEETSSPSFGNKGVNELLPDLQQIVEKEISRDLGQEEIIQLRPMNDEFSIQIVQDGEIQNDGTRNLTVIAKDASGNSILQKSYRPHATTTIGESFIEGILDDLEAELDFQKRSLMAKNSVLGSRFSKASRLQSRLKTINEVKESKSNSTSHGRDNRVDSIHSLDNQRDTVVESPFQSQNVYYRRLLADLEKQSAMRGSTPNYNLTVKNSSGLLRKVNTVAGDYNYPRNSSNKGSAFQRFDNHKSTMDIKQELAKENSPQMSSSRKNISQSRPSNFSDLRIKSPSESLVAKRESKIKTQASFVEEPLFVPKKSTKQSIRHVEETQLKASEHEKIDSFDPNHSLDGQTQNLIEKSKQLKLYLDDYINTLTNSKKKPDHSHHHDIHDQIHSLDKLINQKKQSMAKSTEHKISVQPSKNETHSYHKHLISSVSENDIKAKLKEVFDNEKEKMSTEVLERIKHKALDPSLTGDNLIDEFYKFCEEELPYDKNYKDSVMLVSLFYYFLEKKNIVRS
jgi:hypothetical protein